MSRSGNVWDNAAMESFFSSLKTERTGNKTYMTRDQTRADVFDYIERFYNSKRRHSTQMRTFHRRLREFGGHNGEFPLLCK
jgi:putative transposase